MCQRRWSLYWRHLLLVRFLPFQPQGSWSSSAPCIQTPTLIPADRARKWIRKSIAEAESEASQNAMTKFHLKNRMILYLKTLGSKFDSWNLNSLPLSHFVSLSYLNNCFQLLPLRSTIPDVNRIFECWLRNSKVKMQSLWPVYRI